MTPEQEAKITANAEAVARKYRRKVGWRVQRNELVNVAMVAQLRAVQTFDPAVGVPFGAFAHRAAKIAVSRFVRKMSAPVSAHHDLSVLDGVFHTPLEMRVATDHGTVIVRERSEMRVEADQEEMLLYARWTKAVRDRVTQVIGADGATFAFAVIVGDVPAHKVAEEHKIPVEQVYAATCALKDLLCADPYLRELWNAP